LPVINPDEIGDYLWLDLVTLNQEINATPNRFAPWFQIIVKDARFQQFFLKL
jgi:isopentenyldiphosphate isomerase